MPDYTEIHFCPNCEATTQHVVLLIRKSSPFAKESTIKELLAYLLKGWCLKPFVASMDDFERHIICQSCGNKMVDPR